MTLLCVFFFFQAEDGIRDADVTGVQTCALPISSARDARREPREPLRATNIAGRGPPRRRRVDRRSMRTFRLALRLAARDWRAGELRVLIVAIVLAVASVGTVGFFADRVKQGLSRQANLLLGADLMVSG